MKCPKCGEETGTSKFCPECGADLRQFQTPKNDPAKEPKQQDRPVQFDPSRNQTQQDRPVQFVPPQDRPVQFVPPQNQPAFGVPKKHTGLGIAAFVISFVFPLGIIAVIFGIIDLVRDKENKNKHGLSIAAIAIGGFGVFMMILAAIAPSDNKEEKVAKLVVEESVVETADQAADDKAADSSTEKATASQTTEKAASSQTTEKETAPADKADAQGKLHLGDEFGNKTITGVVIYADLDYKDYNSYWNEVDEGYKAVYIKIKVTNISKKSNYVSVGDFKCYADNVSTDAELISGGKEDYNANIDPGRSAVLGALYIVPENTSSIELEYKPIGESASRQIIVVQDESTTDTILSVDEELTRSENADVPGDVKVIGIGDEFGNKTITGVVTDADLDYKNYNSAWTKLEADQKAVYIKIKVTNISNASNYVSVGDYRCYVDGVITSPELVSGGNEDYNANIDPGRAAILGALYVVPKDAQSIELEYNPIGESSERVIIKIQ